MLRLERVTGYGSARSYRCVRRAYANIRVETRRRLELTLDVCFNSAASRFLRRTPSARHNEYCLGCVSSAKNTAYAELTPIGGMRVPQVYAYPRLSAMSDLAHSFYGFRTKRAQTLC